MNLDAIETLLVEKLKRLLRKQVDVLPGPVATLALGGMQETLFIHAARFEDNSGNTPDGAAIGRRPVRSGRVSGVAEERPCLIIVEVTCIATSYSRIKALSSEISPEILLALACEREFELGTSDNRQSSLKFTDFQSNLSHAETIREEDDHLIFHFERLVFHINGTLQVMLSKYGGLKPKKSTQKKPKVITVKKPVNISKNIKTVKKPKRKSKK